MTRLYPYLFAVALLAMALTAYNSNGDNADTPPLLRTVAEADFTTTSSGLQYYDFAEGNGDTAVAADTTTVTVHYNGWLASDSTLFDSSYERGQPFSFRLGAGEVIQGWDQGVDSMQVGGERQLVIPPALGYGARGAGGRIPPNATLIFEVELLSVSNGS